MKTVELISHCWQFSRVLRYQLESLMRHPPEKVHVLLTVCHSMEDEATVALLNEYFSVTLHPWPHNVAICPLIMETSEALNRSIGRNRAAKVSVADLVWFIDCDYWLGEGCLDALSSVAIQPEEPNYSRLYFPRTVLISRDHTTGDSYSDRIGRGEGVHFDPQDFIPKREKKAIGGIQIVPGDVARTVGYCDGNRRELKPVPNGRWRVTRGDVILRGLLGTSGKAIELPNCYRIRQSIEGVCDTREIAECPQSK